MYQGWTENAEQIERRKARILAGYRRAGNRELLEMAATKAAAVSAAYKRTASREPFDRLMFALSLQRQQDGITAANGL
jgi:hypothetical protein